MKYQVRLTEKAEQDVASALEWFREQAAMAAGAKWLAQLQAKIDTLETRPARCGLAAESQDLGLEIRELLFGKRRGRYRLLFQIRGRMVHILRIWHSARDSVARDDL